MACNRGSAVTVSKAVRSRLRKPPQQKLVHNAPGRHHGPGGADAWSVSPAAVQVAWRKGG